MSTFKDIKLIHQDPPIVLIKNTYTEEEVKLILHELLFLQPNLKGPEESKAGKHKDGSFKTVKNAAWLEQTYLDRSMSHILNINRQMYGIFRGEVDHWFYNKDKYNKLENEKGYYEAGIMDNTLVSYYEEKGRYDTHMDSTIVTAITWFFKEPKNFTGGDLEIPDFNIKIPCTNNTTVVFPGHTPHFVTETNIIDKSIKQSGRFAISQFFLYPGGIRG